MLNATRDKFKQAVHDAFLGPWLQTFVTLPHDGKRYITEGLDHARLVVMIDSVMAQLGATAGPLYWIEPDERLRPGLRSADLGRMFADCLKADIHGMAATFRNHVLPPRVTLFVRTISDAIVNGYPEIVRVGSIFSNADLFPGNLPLVEKLVAQLRLGLKAIEYLIDNRERTLRGKLEGIEPSIQSQFRLRVEVVAVHVRLGYGREQAMLPKELNKNISSIVRPDKSILEAPTWYCWRTDWNPLDGFYHEALLLYRGSRSSHQQLSERLLSHWKTFAPGGTGMWLDIMGTPRPNEGLNANSYSVVCCDDFAARVCLEELAKYIAKVSFFATLKIPGLRKTYSRKATKKPGGKAKSWKGPLHELVEKQGLIALKKFRRPRTPRPSIAVGAISDPQTSEQTASGSEREISRDSEINWAI